MCVVTIIYGIYFMVGQFKQVFVLPMIRFSPKSTAKFAKHRGTQLGFFHKGLFHWLGIMSFWFCLFFVLYGKFSLKEGAKM